MNLFYKFLVLFFIRRLSRTFKGDLVIIFPNNYKYILGSTINAPYFKILNNFLFIRIFFSGVSGISYGYSKKDWVTDDLSYIIRIGLKNIKEIKSLKLNFDYFFNYRKIFSFFYSNTISKSKKQISFHYDLGNNFYKCWLDKTMTYSSGLFYEKKLALQAAQNNKYESLAKLAKIKKSNTILEIGCGWGGFISYISKNIGSNITGITISKNQYHYVRSLQRSNATVKLLDYRKINKSYDKIISIEMFEAVGKKNWNNYFKILNRSLKKKGLAALQIITINENLYSNYERNKDFIQRYIFPGGMLPTKKIIYSLADQNNLSICQEKSLRKDYAKTLEMWRRNFLNSWKRLENMGYSKEFKRLWEYYLTYCEEGFRAETINVYQFLLKKINEKSKL